MIALSVTQEQARATADALELAFREAFERSHKGEPLAALARTLRAGSVGTRPIAVELHEGNRDAILAGLAYVGLKADADKPTAAILRDVSKALREAPIH